jgi:hypothetical protein
VKLICFFILYYTCFSVTIIGLLSNFIHCHVRQHIFLNNSIYTCCAIVNIETTPEVNESNFNLPVFVPISIFIIYIFLGGVMYSALEDWEYVDALYFVFVSLTTIGSIIWHQSFPFVLLDKYYHILYLDINSIISAVLEGHQSVHLVIIIHIVYLRDLFNPLFFSFMTFITRFGLIRKVWRYQRGNQKL